MEMLFFIIFIVILVVIIANWFASVYTQNNYFYNPLIRDIINYQTL